MYKIILPNFEGPLDLMLYFIKKDELNIYDIPIARITEEFLKYIRVMRLFDLELAGEFLVLAVTLMYIKTQMLLPRDENADGTEPEDPRTQLVERLIEYKLFKNAAANLSQLANEQKYIYYRHLFDEDNRLAAQNIDTNYRNATLFDLIKAFRKATEKLDDQPKQYIVPIVSISVEEKVEYLNTILAGKKRLSFFEIVKNENRQNIVVTLLALLEMIKKRIIMIFQDEVFDDIIIANKPPEVVS